MGSLMGSLYFLIATFQKNTCKILSPRFSGIFFPLISQTWGELPNFNMPIHQSDGLGKNLVLDLLTPKITVALSSFGWKFFPMKRQSFHQILPGQTSPAPLFGVLKAGPKMTPSPHWTRNWIASCSPCLCCEKCT